MQLYMTFSGISDDLHLWNRACLRVFSNSTLYFIEVRGMSKLFSSTSLLYFGIVRVCVRADRQCPRRGLSADAARSRCGRHGVSVIE